MSDQGDSTHFGYQRVSPEEKTAKVRDVFDSVAGRYDRMNDLMSLGLHRLWKRFCLARTGLRPGNTAVDVASGTCDLVPGLCRQVGASGTVVATDINLSMLRVGRDRMLDRGLTTPLFTLANAEALPIGERTAHCVTIAFGLRNVTDKARALRSIHSTLKPGGRLLILEFSRLRIEALQPAYDWYSFNVLPRLGAAVAGDAASYRYLAESIRVHPDQSELAAMMRDAGFDDVEVHNLSAGLVALHTGYRL